MVKHRHHLVYLDDIVVGKGHDLMKDLQARKEVESGFVDEILKRVVH